MVRNSFLAIVSVLTMFVGDTCRIPGSSIISQQAKTPVMLFLGTISDILWPTNI